MYKRSLSDFNEGYETRSKRRYQVDKKIWSNFREIRRLKDKKRLSRCDECLQFDVEIAEFKSFDVDTVSEKCAIMQNCEDLDVFELQEYQLDFFTIHDKCNHICQVDGGLLESGKNLYISGYLISKSNDLLGDFAVKNIGPITEWWVSGYNVEDEVTIGVSSDLAHYYLLNPSDQYKAYYFPLRMKTFIANAVIKFLVEDEFLSYNNLIKKLEATNPPDGIDPLLEETIKKYADFILTQIESYNETADSEKLMDHKCINHLKKLSLHDDDDAAEDSDSCASDSSCMSIKSSTSVTSCISVTSSASVSSCISVTSSASLKSVKSCASVKSCSSTHLFQPDHSEMNENSSENIKHLPRKNRIREVGFDRQKSVTTKLVKRVFDEVFQNYIQNNVSESEPDDSAEEVENESFSARFHDQQQDDMFDSEDSSAYFKLHVQYEKLIERVGNQWFYEEVEVGDETYKIGDCVLIKVIDDPSEPYELVKIVTIYETLKTGGFHALLFSSGRDTVLGKTASENEYFILNQCLSFEFSSIKLRSDIIYRPPSLNWKIAGGEDVEEKVINVEGRRFFYNKFYDYKTCRFEDPPTNFVDIDPKNAIQCPNCVLKDKKKKENTLILNEICDEDDDSIKYTSIKWKNDEYQANDCVFMLPSAFPFKNKFVRSVKSTVKKVNENKYPEYYRKGNDRNNCEDSKYQTEPFRIGIIQDIFTRRLTRDVELTANDVLIRVKKFYRPENTHLGPSTSYEADYNMVYWSDEVTTVRWSQVHSKCHVVQCSSSEAESLYHQQYFYFNQSYDSTTGFFGVPTNIPEELSYSYNASYERKVEPLQTMDAFCGCGGLSEGLRQSGVAKILWAIENDENPAMAFLKNNIDCNVFPYNCNKLLSLLMNRSSSDEENLPEKGDVELLCGGPPCQGYSGLNRWSKGNCAWLKNSLVTTLLSLCDWFRPRFFVLENVENFIRMKKHIILQLTLKCLLAIGYQCTFTALQAGNFGLPQNRKRLFILAAAPGEHLPQYPYPMHVFDINLLEGVCVNRMRMLPRPDWPNCAPYRRVTIRDAIFDLLDIDDVVVDRNKAYYPDVQSHFQKLMRKDDQQSNVIGDHICQSVSPLSEARISNIPLEIGADWRDLPNIEVTLSNGIITKKLKYDFVKYSSGHNEKRGVCICITKNRRDTACNVYRQSNTLIPWCLVHTGDDHNHWSGSYGRLDADGIFSTLITKPSLIGKVGKIIHPLHHRILSVREYARAQGFPDNYQFSGPIAARYKQIGNAVPPPLARAIGIEIKKCL